MATIIQVGALPPGTLPIELYGGLVTSMSGSPNEISRTVITDPLTGNLIYKRVIMGNSTITLTLQGGTPPGVGAPVDVGALGVAGGLYKCISAAPSGSSGEVASFSIVAEDFSL